MSKKNKQKRTRREKGKLAMKIILSIVLVIVLIITIFAVLNAISANASKNLAASFQPVENAEVILPQKDENGTWTFTTDRELKILQITDVHIGGGILSVKKDAMAINAVASMVTVNKPDLVVVTGDIAYPVPFAAGTMNNKKAADIFATLMEHLGVSWIPMFGNHDTEVYSYYTREDMGDFYESEDLKHCLFRKGPSEIDGVGNSIIEVKNPEGIVTQSLCMIDSHSYTDDDKMGILWHYDNIHQNQIDWYKESTQAISQRNVARIEELYADDAIAKETALRQFGEVTSLVFFHIPTTEYKDAWNEYVANGYQNTENVNLHYGMVGEKGSVISCPVEDDNMFEAMQSFGGQKGIFCGHDHMNNYSLDYKGIRLTYGYSIDYLAYIGIAKVGSQRGCTIITLEQNGDFDCMCDNYYQSKYKMFSNREKEHVIMQDMTQHAQGEVVASDEMTTSY